MPTETQQTDIVTEARAKLANPTYGMGKRNRELITKLCDEVERLRGEIDIANSTIEGLLDRIGVRNDN